jgi:hypothetical protein
MTAAMTVIDGDKIGPTKIVHGIDFAEVQGLGGRSCNFYVEFKSGKKILITDEEKQGELLYEWMGYMLAAYKAQGPIIPRKYGATVLTTLYITFWPRRGPCSDFRKCDWRGRDKFLGAVFLDFDETDGKVEGAAVLQKVKDLGLFRGDEICIEEAPTASGWCTWRGYNNHAEGGYTANDTVVIDDDRKGVVFTDPDVIKQICMGKATGWYADELGWSRPEHGPSHCGWMGRGWA